MIDDCGVRPEGCVLRTLFGYISKLDGLSLFSAHLKCLNFDLFQR